MPLGNVQITTISLVYIKMSSTKKSVNINKIIAVPIWLGIYFGLTIFMYISLLKYN